MQSAPINHTLSPKFIASSGTLVRVDKPILIDCDSPKPILYSESLISP